MFGERRRHQRHSINRIAKFHTDSGSLPRDCTIVDISLRGARLFSDVEMPDLFYLVVTGEKPIRETCRVVWRLGGELGVEFETVAHERRA